MLAKLRCFEYRDRLTVTTRTEFTLLVSRVASEHAFWFTDTARELRKSITLRLIYTSPLTELKCIPFIVTRGHAHGAALGFRFVPLARAGQYARSDDLTRGTTEIVYVTHITHGHGSWPGHIIHATGHLLTHVTGRDSQ